MQIDAFYAHALNSNRTWPEMRLMSVYFDVWPDLLTSQHAIVELWLRSSGVQDVEAPSGIPPASNSNRRFELEGDHLARDSSHVQSARKGRVHERTLRKERKCQLHTLGMLLDTCSPI